MKCTKCNLYSYGLRRCTRGKINPDTIKGGVDAAKVFGLDYICGLCELRDKIKNALIKWVLEEV